MAKDAADGGEIAGWRRRSIADGRLIAYTCPGNPLPRSKGETGMLRHGSILLGAACCLGLAWSSPTIAGDCQPQPGREPIRVNVDADGTPTVSADSVTVCVGEQVRWVFGGSGGREFAIIFRGADGSPFDWERQTGNTVLGTVRQDAAQEGQAKPYKYDVEVDGKALDPIIIVEK